MVIPCRKLFQTGSAEWFSQSTRWALNFRTLLSREGQHRRVLSWCTWSISHPGWILTSVLSSCLVACDSHCWSLDSEHEVHCLNSLGPISGDSEACWLLQAKFPSLWQFPLLYLQALSCSFLWSLVADICTSAMVITCGWIDWHNEYANVPEHTTIHTTYIFRHTTSQLASVGLTQVHPNKWVVLTCMVFTKPLVRSCLPPTTKIEHYGCMDPDF